MNVPKKPRLFDAFWRWYERYYGINIAVAAGLFLLQIVHLYWLTSDVVLFRLTGASFFSPSAFYEYLIIIVDYTEIPALVSTSILYLHEFKKIRWRAVLFLILINSQWLHLFWITDEFVVQRFMGESGTILPLWLAWVAIGIDYLELPVIVDTLLKLVRAVRARNFSRTLREEVQK